MNSYFVTFPSGISEVVKVIFERTDGYTIVEISDGIAQIQTRHTVSDIAKFRFLTNIYYLLGKSVFNKTIENTVQHFNPILYPLPRLLSKKFKVRVSYIGQTVAFDKRSLVSIEQRVQRFYRLALDPDAKANEFWFYIRDNGHVYFGLKASNEKIENKVRMKGELKVETSSLMASLITKTEATVLEPFAGYGGLASEIVQNTNVSTCHCNDVDGRRVEHLKVRFRGNKRVTISNTDYRKLTFNMQFDYLVSDPPWGEFDSKISYAEMIECAQKWIKDTGTLAVLISDNTSEELIEALDRQHFGHKKYNVLVGGNKAFIVVAQRIL